MRTRLTVAAALAVVFVAVVALTAAAVAATRPHPKVVFLGDSYTAGSGASVMLKTGFAALLSDHEGWKMSDLGRGSTGYLTSNHDGHDACGLQMCPNYDQMIPAAHRAHPTLIVVTGGRNDTGQPPAAEKAAVFEFYRHLRAEFPDTPIVAVSPIWDSTTPPAELAAIAGWVHAAAAKNRATYLDIGEPLAGKPEDIIQDHIHPNDAGHRAIAAALEHAIAQHPAALTRR